MIVLEKVGAFMNILPYIIGISVSLCSFLFYLFLSSFYFYQSKKSTLKNQLYRKILLCGFGVILFDTIYQLGMCFSFPTYLLILSRKVTFFFLVPCLLLWTYYVFLILFQKNKKICDWIRKNHVKIDFFLYSIFLTLGILIFVLPLSFHYNELGILKSTYGSCFLFCLVVFSLLGLLPLPFFFVYRRDVPFSKMIPYFVILFLEIGVILFTYFYSSYSLFVPFLTLSCFFIYFFLEDPDLVYVRGYHKSRDEIRKIREEYGFLFNMSPELRDLLNEISFMKENYLVDGKKNISRKKLETLIYDFIKSSEEGKTTQTKIDEDGIEILEEDDPPEEMLITKEIYSLDELQAVLEEDNLPKW